MNHDTMELDERDLDVSRYQTSLQTDCTRWRVGDPTAFFDDGSFHGGFWPRRWDTYGRNPPAGFLLRGSPALDIFFEHRHAIRHESRQQLSLITKVYFPRSALTVAPTLAGMVELEIGTMFLVAMMVFYNLDPTWKFVL
jgi:hypothetical protein